MKELKHLIPEEYRWGAVKVAALVPVRAILDLAGVAALLPVMMLVLDSDRLHSSFLGKWYDALGFASEQSFAFFIIGTVLLFLAVKICLCILVADSQNRYLMSLYRTLSSSLFISLYSRGLAYIKNQNSSRMTFNIISVCRNFVMGYLGGWMRLMGEAVFVLFMLAGLLLYSPGATAMALCAFIPVVALYIMLIRKPLKELAKKENEARREQNRLVTEAFKGYSEVHVNDAFPHIKERFDEGLGNISSYRIRSSVISSIPSYAMEFAAVMVVAVLMLFSFSASDSSGILSIGVFTVAMLKLMPAVRSIISSLSALSATEYTKEIISDIKTPAAYDLLHKCEDVAPMEFDKGIEVRNLSFTFPDDDVPVLENLSFSISKGDRFGIKGRTGSGKTTLFNILLGLYPPGEGEVLIDGTALDSDNMASWHRIVGYVPQDVFVADSTILENIALGCGKDTIDPEKAMSALEQASLGGFVKGLPDGIDTRIGEAGCKLSGGQRQRLGIARALFKDAKVLFFDEATSALDSVTEKEINEAIAELSDTHSELTIIVISHRDTTISFCDKTIEL